MSALPALEMSALSFLVALVAGMPKCYVTKHVAGVKALEIMSSGVHHV